MSFDIRVTFTVSFICAVFLESLTLQNHVIGGKEVKSVRDSVFSQVAFLPNVDVGCKLFFKCQLL